MGPDLDELLRLYGDEPLHARTLNGTEFQQAVFVRMFRRCNLRGNLRNEPQGEVDFVLIEQRTDHGGAVVGEQRHLFECKNYDRTIELRDAAKLMMVGLRRPAASLNLVSSTNLQPQALEYAHFFFPFENERAVERKLGGSTIFRHFVTHDLLGFNPVVQDADYKSTSGSAAEDAIIFELTELRPYSEHPLDLTHSKPQVVSLKNHYRFEATLSSRSRSRDARLTLVDICDGIDIIDTQSTVDAAQRVIQLSTLFRLKVPPTTRELRLQLCVSKGTKTTPRVQLAPLRVDDDLSNRYDFRPQETQRFEGTYRNPNVWRVALLTGEAGTGKTWLCDRFAQEVRAKLGWDVVQFDILENASGDLFRELAVSLLLPSRFRSEVSLSDLRVLAGDVFDTIAGGARNGRGPDDSVEPTEFVAQVAVGLGARLIVIRNLERADEVTANALRRLILALARRGWGDVRLILEGRPGREEDHWTSLRRDVSRIVDYVVAFHLEPMARDEVGEMLDGLFEEIPSELKQVCWRRAGGYPLFLRNFFDFLEKEGAVEQVGGRLRVVSPSAFSAELLSGLTPSADPRIVGGRSDAILIARLNALRLSSLDLCVPFDDAHFVLGLYALAETPVRMAALTAMLRLDDAESQLALALRDENVLGDEALPGQLGFRHDLLREAAIVMARGRSRGDALDALAAALPLGLDTHDPVELELLGDLRRFAGQEGAAWTHYQRAVSAASHAENFIDVCRLTRKQNRLYERDKSRSGARFVDHVHALLAQAWAEWNCGSVQTARDTYRRIIELGAAPLDAGIDSSIMRRVLSAARSRLVGINLALFDFEEFVTSATVALSEDGDVAAYNSVLNRIVLCCSRLSLPDLGLQFVDLATNHVAHRDDDVEREIDGEAVICADAARLFMQTAPDAVRPLLAEELEQSRRARQRLHANIDLLSAAFLASGELDFREHDALRDEAVKSGLYDFLTRLFALRSVAALRDGHVAEAAQYFEQVRSRTVVRHSMRDDIDLCNNGLLLALAGRADADARRWARRLVKCVSSALDGRDRVLQAFSEDIPRLAAARSDTLGRRHGFSRFQLPLPFGRPTYSGALAVGWLNLRRIAAHGTDELAATASEIAERILPSFDLGAAEAAFDRAAERCGISYGMTRLSLYVE